MSWFPGSINFFAQELKRPHTQVPWRIADHWIIAGGYV
jgi:hypothetical protein